MLLFLKFPAYKVFVLPPAAKRRGEAQMTPSKIAQTWIRIYFVFEITWTVLWVVLMPLYKFALSEADGAAYRLGHELQGLHLGLMPSVAYGLEDGNKIIIAVLYASVIWSDLSRLLEIVLYTKPVIDWAWGTSLATAAYGLFVGVFALGCFIYIWVNNVRFKNPKTGLKNDPTL